MGSERRSAPRVRIRLEVAYEDAERQVFLTTSDLSEAGVFLLSPDPPPPGVSVRLVFELPGHPPLLRFPAVVTRRQAAPRSGFAVRFDSMALPAGTAQALRRYVEQVSLASSEPIK